MATAGGLLLKSGGSVSGQTRSPGDLFSLPAAAFDDPVLSFTCAHFAPFVNTDFQARQEDSPERANRLRLLKVEEKQRRENLERGFVGSNFSLLFEFQSEKAVAAAGGSRFEFSHATLGTFTLFLTPVSAAPDRFEAIISHLGRR